MCYRQGSEHPERLLPEKFLARLIPHRLIYNMDRHVFKQIQGMHKISPDLRAIQGWSVLPPGQPGSWKHGADLFTGGT